MAAHIRALHASLGLDGFLRQFFVGVAPYAEKTVRVELGPKHLVSLLERLKDGELDGAESMLITDSKCASLRFDVHRRF